MIKKIKDLTEEEMENQGFVLMLHQNGEGDENGIIPCKVIHFDKSVNDFLNTKIDIPDKHILDKQEHDYLRAVCKPYKVIYIYKLETEIGNQYIQIVVKSSVYNSTASLSMPLFTKDTMYKGMELDKNYTIQELELDKERNNKMKLELETKFNIGDKVKGYSNGEICTIKDIHIDINEHGIRNTRYHIVNEQNNTDLCLSGCQLEKEHILDKQEHDYLRAVCKPYKVKYIRKFETMVSGKQFIEIVIKSSIDYSATASWSMPCFNRNSMYKGMKLDKKYTIEELELDKEWNDD